ncbi:MAG TPA: hypothetical protein VGX28_00860 [Frankiaceae bacterium]|jgi:hypothetical protein|nr:hypothetical protein [Frankiaceae bacterium]
MRLSRLAFAVAATAAMTAFPVAPAGAGSNVSITAAPTTLKPGEQTTVTGTTDCNSVAYTVTITYTKPDESTGTATANGTTDASGEFTQAIALPEDATAGEAASVSAAVACGGGSQNSNTVNLEVEAYEGTLTVDPTSGETGTTVTVHGTNCYGGDVTVAFGDGEEFPYEVDVVLAPDKTFSGTFTIPDEAGPGSYAFAAACPGTDYNLAPFTVVAGAGASNPPTPSAPPAAPPATPVVDTPNFTG